MFIELTASGRTGADVVHSLRQQATHLKAQADHDPERAAIVDAAVREVEQRIGGAMGSSTARITVVVQYETATVRSKTVKPAPVRDPVEDGSAHVDYPPVHEDPPTPTAPEDLAPVGG